jgi:hypothetical protein
VVEVKGHRYSDGDLSRALALLPTPLFRANDIFNVAVQLGFRMSAGQGLWTRLQKDGLIVRTNIQIGKSPRRLYWERVPQAMPPHEERIVL